MPGISATQHRQFLPFWGSLLLKLDLCSFEICILITFPTTPKFALWSYAEYRPLIFSLVPGLRVEEQVCFHGWGSVLHSSGPFAPFFVSLSPKGSFQTPESFTTKFGDRKTWVFALIPLLTDCVNLERLLKFSRLSFLFFKMCLIDNL